MESAEIKDTHLHVQNFINKAHFSQKLIFFANKIFGYFDFCIFFFFYITLIVTFLQVNFIFLIVLYIFPVCLLSFLVVYELKSFIYIYIYFISFYYHNSNWEKKMVLTLFLFIVSHRLPFPSLFVGFLNKYIYLSVKNDFKNQ